MKFAPANPFVTSYEDPSIAAMSAARLNERKLERSERRGKRWPFVRDVWRPCRSN